MQWVSAESATTPRRRPRSSRSRARRTARRRASSSWRRSLSAMLATIWMCTQEWSLISRRTTALTFATCHQPFSWRSSLTRSISLPSFRLPRTGTRMRIPSTASRRRQPGLAHRLLGDGLVDASSVSVSSSLTSAPPRSRNYRGMTGCGSLGAATDGRECPAPNTTERLENQRVNARLYPIGERFSLDHLHPDPHFPNVYCGTHQRGGVHRLRKTKSRRMMSGSLLPILSFSSSGDMPAARTVTVMIVADVGVEHERREAAAPARELARRDVLDVVSFTPTLGDLLGPVAVEARVEPAARDQLLVRALLDDLAVLEHDDQVGVADRREPVRDHERRAAGEQTPQRPLDLALGADVDGRRRLVEDQDARVGKQRAGEGDELALAEREAEAALAELRVVAVLELADEAVRADRLARRPRSPRGAARAAEGDVLARPCRRRGSPPAARSRAAGAATPASPSGGRGRRS